MLDAFYTISQLPYNVVVRNALELNPLLFQFISAVDICQMNTFLHGCLIYPSQLG